MAAINEETMPTKKKRPGDRLLRYSKCGRRRLENSIAKEPPKDLGRPPVLDRFCTAHEKALGCGSIGRSRYGWLSG
jgi:hypothetical protein